jgi:hypothetical protein
LIQHLAAGVVQAVDAALLEFVRDQHFHGQLVTA